MPREYFLNNYARLVFALVFLPRFLIVDFLEATGSDLVEAGLDLEAAGSDLVEDGAYGDVSREQRSLWAPIARRVPFPSSCIHSRRLQAALAPAPKARRLRFHRLPAAPAAVQKVRYQLRSQRLQAA